MNKDDLVCYRSGRGWSPPRKVVEVVRGIWVNIGHVGNGQWLPVEKLRPYAAVQQERIEKVKARAAEKPMAKLRALMMDGKERHITEMAEHLKLWEHTVRCMAGRIGLDRPNGDTYVMRKG